MHVSNQVVARLPQTVTIIASLLLGGCTTHLFVKVDFPEGWKPSATIEKCNAPAAPFSPDVALLADPQLHNIYGGGLMTDSLLMEPITRVAVRPPALNLWSEIVLGSFASELLTRFNTGSQQEHREPILLVLGDASNVACTGELKHFFDVLNASTHGVGAWLTLHGNHDSYMMGNLNSYGRHKNLPPLKPTTTAKGIASPLSDSQYTAAECREFAYDRNTQCSRPFGLSSWAAACADPLIDSVPSYKGVWLRHYLGQLEQQQVHFAVDGTPATSEAGGQLDASLCAPHRKFEGTADATSPLGHRDYWVTGEMFSRIRVSGDAECNFPRLAYELNTYRSYAVQSFKLNSEIRAILIDTDHRPEVMRGGPGAVREKLPGENGNIDDEGKDGDQLRDIALHVFRARKDGQRVVFFAHHPLSQLPSSLQSALLMHHPIAYISAHTHAESSVAKHRVNDGSFVELNVASTTDWPMEGMMLSVAKNKLRWKVVGLRSDMEGKDGSVCAYEKAQFAPDESTCHKLLDDGGRGELRDYTAYKSAPGQLHHQLCYLADELNWLKTGNWPGDRSLFTRVPSSLAEGKSWMTTATSMALLVNDLREQARRSKEARNFAICTAMRASFAESKTYGATDGAIERSSDVNAAALFSGAEVSSPDPPTGR